MAEKTEQPTPKKLRDARKKGQLLFSRDIVSLATLASGLVALTLFWPGLFQRLNATLDETFLLAPAATDTALPAILQTTLIFVFHATLLILVATLLASIAANLAQIGFLFSFAKLTRGFKSLDAVANARNLFSKKNLFSFFMNIAKTCVVLGVFVYVFINRLDDFLTSPSCGLACVLETGLRTLLYALGLAVLAFIPLAALDYLFQRRFHLHDLMMSKDEVKQEYKESEGNPEIKGQRRQIHREVLESQEQARTEQASVVVRNPTHYAVALHYDEVATPLPVVVAKGEGARAAFLVRVAERAGVPVWDDPTLAQALYFGVELDNYIAAEHLDAVAEALIYVADLNP